MDRKLKLYKGVLCILILSGLTAYALVTPTLAAPTTAIVNQNSTDGKITIYGGTKVPIGELEAVGILNGGSCTATLITYNRVLTAAHCVEGTTRATFTLKDVYPLGSNTRKDITIGGNVRINPEYQKRGWLRDDNAVIELDRPVNQLTNVRPMDVEIPRLTPLEGDYLTLVGFCTGKSKATLPVKASNWGGIRFSNTDIYVCPGDSGGPIIDYNMHVVGTASWGDNYNSIYRPTSFAYSWIFKIPQPKWSSTSWVGIEQAGKNSHQPIEYCTDGGFVTALDLDGGPDDWIYPVIGQARCSKVAGAEYNGYGSSRWFKVTNSHQPTPEWCPGGSFITGLDLDNTDLAWLSPVVGQVQCSTLKGYNQYNWGSSYWIDIEREGINSHQPNQWCLDGSYLTQYDLDANFDLLASDSPIVGRAKCSRPLKDNTPPSSIYGLKNSTYKPTYIKWIWKDPSNYDFAYVRVYINGVVKWSVPKGVQYYNLTRLYPNRFYTISTRTIDWYGNLNKTWVNKTARTAPK